MGEALAKVVFLQKDEDGRKFYFAINEDGRPIWTSDILRAKRFATHDNAADYAIERVRDACTPTRVYQH